MKRFPSLSAPRLALLAALAFLLAPDAARAEANFGPNVDAFCSSRGQTPYADLMDPNTFFNECTLCHDSVFPTNLPSSGNLRPAEGAAYLSGNYDFFCPLANQAPTLQPIGPKTTTEGMNLSFALVATDPDGDGLAFGATGLPMGAVLTDNADGTASFDWTPAVGDAGVYNVTFTVTDDGSPAMSAMETVVITVFNANQPPVLAPIGDQSIDEGAALMLAVSASDPDGQGLTLQASNLPTGATFTDNGNGTGAFDWTPGFDQAGNFGVTFTVTDDGNPMLSDAETITITVGDVNRPPVLAPIGNRALNEGETLQIALAATDPDGDGLTLSASGLPTGATFSDDGGGAASFDWTPAFGQTGNFTVVFTVMDDGTPNATDSETVVISVGDVNRAPAVTPIGNRQVDEGMSLAFDVTATDPDGDAVSWQVASAPQGSSFTDNGNGSGSFAWTPAYDQAGNHTLSFTATDNGNPSLSTTETITITVGDVNRPPVLAPVGDRQVDEGATLQIALTATDPDGDGLTIQVAGAPPGAQLLDNGDGTATFAWTPGFGAAGNHTVTFSVVDDGTPMAMDQETLTITVGDVNRPPVLAPVGNRAANTNQPLAFDVAASDPDGDAVALVATGLPTGASFVDNGDGTGSFAWTPGAGDTGNHTVTFTATDAGSPALSVSETITIAVDQVNNPPMLVAIGNRTVVLGDTLSFALLASDPDGHGLSFSALNAPAGASLVDNGDGTARFTWTPPPAALGSVDVTFVVTDDGLPPLSDEETINVAIDGAAVGFGITEAAWWDTWGGHVDVSGTGAAPGALVDLHDADTGTLLAQLTAGMDGSFSTGQCFARKVKRRGRRRWLVMQDCAVPFQPPCAVQVRSDGMLSARTAVTNPAPSCGAASEPMLDAMAWIIKRRGRRNILQVAGSHAPAMADVEIRDALTDTVMATVQADANGRFAWRQIGMACWLRLVSNGEVSEPIQVMQRRKRGKRRVMVPLRFCSADPALATPGSVPAGSAPSAAPGGTVTLPGTPPAGPGAGGAGGGGAAGGGSGSGGAGMPGGGSAGGSGAGGVIDPAEQANYDAFLATVQPLTGTWCTACHAGAGPGSPDIAHPDTQRAYRAVWDTQKVNLGQPLASRLVQRLATDRHFCWSGDCDADAETMRAAIGLWAMMVGGGGSGGNQAQSITSASRSLVDAQQDAGSLRVDDAVIARWEFKEGAGNVAADTSGVAPAMDLELVGATWLGEGGVEVSQGYGKASQAASRKLYDRIADATTGSQEYTIEAWIASADLDQRGPARIVTYSVDPYNRNFMMGQDNYNYVYRNRSRASGISNNGTPNLTTADADRDLETELQHVVMTFDQTQGRRIYVDGVFTDDVDSKGPGSLTNWNRDYTFLLANELTNNRQWKGRIHFVAIHARALQPVEIARNFEAGTGERFVLTFDVSSWSGIPGTSVELEVYELDAFSYVFRNPTWRGPAGAGVPVRNIRIMVNGQVPVAGQAFRTLDTVASQDGQVLSPLASVIAKDQGPDADVFSLAFETLGDNVAVVADAGAPVTPGGFTPAPAPSAGIRSFAQINDTMAALTGVDPGDGEVRETYLELRQQLPTGNDIRSFVSAHQVGIFKLALSYCDALVDRSSLRDPFFAGTGFDFGQGTAAAMADPAVTRALAERLVDTFVGVGLATQPDRQLMSDEVTGLLDTLSRDCRSDTCDRTHSRGVVKAACSAVLGSAPVHIH